MKKEQHLVENMNLRLDDWIIKERIFDGCCRDDLSYDGYFFMYVGSDDDTTSFDQLLFLFRGGF